MSFLHAGIDVALPQRLTVGTSATLYIAGWCFHETRPVHAVEIVVNGVPQSVMASHMPRYDVFQRFRLVAGGGSSAYLSGFWGIVDIGVGSARVAQLSLRVRIDGAALDHALGEIVLDRFAKHGDVKAPGQVRPDPLVAICMATHEPDAVSFRRQVETIRDQTYENWICIINDDCSSAGSFEMMREVIAGDTRFSISRNEVRLGFYDNFAACLSLVPQRAEYVALSDQDDRWYADKVATLLARLRRDGAVLAFSDMRIVDADHRVLHDSFWRRGQRNNYVDLGALLCANTMTGAASLFSRRLLDALPFPHLSVAYHDHWLASVALARGRVSYVDRPLHDYVQHSRNVLGYNRPPGRGAPAPRTPQGWYFVNVVTAVTFSREILLRFAEELSEDKRAVLEQVARLDSASGAAWLLRRWTRNVADVRLAHLLAGVAWRHSLQRLARIPTRLLSVSESDLPASGAVLGEFVASYGGPHSQSRM